jgi:hypothetical protein
VNAPKNKRMMTKRIPSRLRSKDFKNEKEFFNFRLGEISPGPAKKDLQQPGRILSSKESAL